MNYTSYNSGVPIIINKLARREYEILSTFTAGLLLTGPEVKSLRLGQASLRGSHVKIIGTEAFLLNAQITPYRFASQKELEPKRTRKLLLKRRELDRLIGASQEKGRTLVPLAFKTGRTIKLEIGIGRGKKQHEKREELKRREQKREVERTIRGRLRGF